MLTSMKSILIFNIIHFVLYAVLMILLFRFIVKLAKKQKRSVANICLCLFASLMMIAVTYFTFIHGSIRKPAVDLDDCVNSFDEILNLDLEKQDEPLWCSNSETYYSTTICDNNDKFEIYVIYGDVRPEFDVREGYSNAFEATFSKYFTKSTDKGGITCTASALYANKDKFALSKFFNGNYSGEIHLKKDNINIIIDYTVTEKRLGYYLIRKPHPIQISEVL